MMNNPYNLPEETQDMFSGNGKKTEKIRIQEGQNYFRFYPSLDGSAPVVPFVYSRLLVEKNAWRNGQITEEKQV